MIMNGSCGKREDLANPIWTEVKPGILLRVGEKHLDDLTDNHQHVREELAT